MADGLQIPSGRRVIPAAEAGTLMSADALEVELRQRRASLEREADDSRRDAEVAGYAEGQARARAELAEKLVALEIASQQREREALSLVADTVLDALESVLRLADRQVLLRAACRQVEARLRHEVWARMRVHPESVAAARVALEATVPDAVHVSVLGDPRLDEAACLFETASGTSDVSLDVLFTSLRRAVREVIPNGPDASPPQNRSRAEQPSGPIRDSAGEDHAAGAEVDMESSL